MKIPRLLLATLALAGAASAQTPALVVLDFEDLVGFAPMPAGYGGVMDWGSWAHSDAVDANYPPASGAVRVFSVGLQRRIRFGEDVIFEGANVVSALPFAWKMYHQGQLVATSATLQPNTGGPAVWLASGYAGPVDELEYDSAVNVHSVDDFQFVIGAFTGTGVNYCTATANSTGAPGVMGASGSAAVALNDLTLEARDLPVNQFGIFIVSRTQGFLPLTSSNGNLCVAGSIGRFVGPGEILSSGPGGAFSLAVDLTAVPEGAGTVAVNPGETWYFQAWFRDGVGQGSNLTDGLEIVFL